VNVSILADLDTYRTKHEEKVLVQCIRLIQVILILNCRDGSREAIRATDDGNPIDLHDSTPSPSR
jgi:hypothetical protein